MVKQCQVFWAERVLKKGYKERKCFWAMSKKVVDDCPISNKIWLVSTFLNVIGLHIT